MDAALFRRLSALAAERAGIALSETREALVRARVGQRVRALGLADDTEYIRLLESDRSGQEFMFLLDALGDSSPLFFREPSQFEDLMAAVRAWYDAGQRRFRLWTATAGTGEEPYSIAIAVLEALEGREADVRVLGTDPSSRALRVASEGVFEDTVLDGLARERRRRYFRAVGGKAKKQRLVRIDAALRDLVVFKRLNLATTPYPMRGPLDAVFCRDVLTYLEKPARDAVVAEIDRLLRPEGLLFLGRTESLAVARGAIVPVRTSVYRREVPGDSGVRASV